MTDKLTHDDAFASLEGVALHALDESERDAVLAHVSECDICNPELDRLRATVAHLALAPAPLADSPNGSRARIRERLMARVAADAPARRMAITPLDRARGDGAARVLGPPRREPRTNAEWLAIAAGVLLVAGIALLVLSYRQQVAMRVALSEQREEMNLLRRRNDSLATVAASGDSLLAALAGRDVAVLTLAAGGPGQPSARLFLDRATNRWTLIAHSLQALAPDRTYQLWLITSNARISGGTFGAPNGDALLRATYALAPDSLRAVAITEEQAGGAEQPTTAPILSANVPANPSAMR